MSGGKKGEEDSVAEDAETLRCAGISPWQLCDGSVFCRHRQMLLEPGETLLSRRRRASTSSHVQVSQHCLG